MRRDQDNALEALMEQLIESGTEEMASFFAALRVRPAHRDARRSTPRPEKWLSSNGRKTSRDPSNSGSRACPSTPRLNA